MIARVLTCFDQFPRVKKIKKIVYRCGYTYMQSFF